MLYQRGVKTSEEAREFLCPSLASLPSPMSMKGVEEAVTLIIRACREKVPLLVHGDYDVDGITGTALLLEFFREMGAETYCYIPNRLNEKYGLSERSLNKLTSNISNRKGLVVTVDCGISSLEEVDYLKKCGHRIIITDHHEPPEVLPDADAVLNPKQPGCRLGFPWLSGVGVAFYLIFAIRSKLVELGTWHPGGAPNLKDYLDLVALGTVADVMPLVGMNRILVKAGLEVLSQRKRPGILALCELSGLREGLVQTDDIAFKLAPRINASGRLGMPEQGVALFTAKDLVTARGYANILDKCNADRKELEKDVLPEVYAQCEELIDNGMQALTIFQEDCHPGVLGIIASRAAERFMMPTIILTKDNGELKTAKGSGRSVGNLNLYKVLIQCGDYMEQFGGHAKAVGLTIQHGKIEEFSKIFSEIVGRQFGDLREKNVETVWEIPAHRLFNKAFTRALMAMQPFGEGNPEPTFLLSKQQVERVSSVKGHLKFSLRDKSRSLPGIGFNLADCEHRLEKPVDIFCKIKRTCFRGVERDEIQAIHFK